MKKILFAAITLLCIWAVNAAQVLVENQYWVEESHIVDEAEVDFSLTKNGSPGGQIQICPGSGFICSFEIMSDPEGSPIYLYGHKGKGEPNIKFVR